MTSNTTKQFKCPVDGCYKTFNSSLQMGNHIQMMIKNGHEDHNHLMSEVNRTPPNQEDNEEEDELPEVDEIQPEESEPVNPEEEHRWMELEPRVSECDRKLVEAGFTHVRKQALERVQHPAQLEPGQDLR